MTDLRATMASLRTTSTALELPPLDCSLILPDLIGFQMERNPTFPMFVYPNEKVPGTTTEISLLEFGRAAHRVAPALNLINPCSAIWADVIRSIGLSFWRRRPKGASGELVKTPAIQLLEFFHMMALGNQVTRQTRSPITEAGGMTNFSTTNSQRVSPTMAHMQPIGGAETESWVRYWISKGSF
ncbi:hypothetical protein PAXINDRAFT_104177 [Paxillus involutus ATCC 200175]|uniref:Uncharacterized protein n=1 Tax=Paxillus involutus ATCC 200175 TaxID=664439 RepID=A0A0C9SLH6_PAXIN|nr:hypothetical protein PAXINDRAFT_104177 [Paxillus involutus ATCC 200175]